MFLSSTFFKFLSPHYYIAPYLFSHVTSIGLRLLSTHPSQINITLHVKYTLIIVYFHLQSCSCDDARRLRSSVHTSEILTPLLLSLGKFPQPTAYMYILMCIIVKRRINWYVFIYASLHMFTVQCMHP